MVRGSPASGARAGDSRNEPARWCASSSDITSSRSARSAPARPSTNDARSASGRSSAAWNSSLTRRHCSLTAGEFPIQPRPGDGPAALDGGGRDPEDLRGLLDGEAAEESEFDDVFLLRVERRE